MDFMEYRRKSRRTQNMALTHKERLTHSLFGMGSELTEIMANLDQHPYQCDGILDEGGDLCWMLAEYCDCIGIEDVEAVRPTEVSSYGGGSCRIDGERRRNMVALAYYIGKIQSAHQKVLQGHPIIVSKQSELVAHALGILELIYRAKSKDVNATISDIYEYNVEKLMKRYPDGFTEERSVNR